MTLKQRRFAREYVTDLNATRAAIRAGYSRKGAAVQGARLLRNAKVKAEVERLGKRKDAELGLSNERIMDKIADIAFSTDEETRDRLRALDLLCKARGMYNQTPDKETETVVFNLDLGLEPRPTTPSRPQLGGRA